jgi:hypothetical protein
MLRALSAALAVAVVAALLYLLAQGLVRHGIDRQARNELTLYAQGRTPWDWQPRQPDDVVAGRAFGGAVLRQGAGGLNLESEGGEYEVGLPLPRPIDLHGLPRLRITTASTLGFSLRLSLAERMGAPRLTSNALDIPSGVQATTVDLARLRWHRPGAAAAIPAPSRAAMLRLRLHQPAGTTLTLREVRWLPGAGASLPGPASVRELPHDLSAESLLRQRDAMQATRPMAVVVADAGWRQAPSVMTSHQVAAWWGLGAWLAAMLALLAWRRFGEDSAALRVAEIVACMAPPLAWAIGLHRAGEASRAWLVALCAALLFACVLEWRLRPRQWRWASGDWRDWAWPMAVVVVALMVAVYARVTPRWLGMGHVATYFGWAALQQLLMLGVVATQLERLLRSRFIVVLVVAVLFALAHAPNGWLMQFCLAAELWWCWRFLRRPVLLPVALAHALAGLLLESVLPGLPLRSLEIGARFLT